MRHPVESPWTAPTPSSPTQATSSAVLAAAAIAAIAVFAFTGFHPAQAADGRSALRAPSPAPSARPVRAPSPEPASTDPERTATSSTAARERSHRDRDDVIVFGDPYWDPLWDIDADLMLGYVPYAYPPAPVYEPKGAVRRGLVPIELHVHPWTASVIVDESVLGEARDYNDDSHPLFLSPGTHKLELLHPGYETLSFDLDVQRGVPRDLHYTLLKGRGTDPRSMPAAPDAEKSRS